MNTSLTTFMEYCKTKSLISAPSSLSAIKHKESEYRGGATSYWYDDLKYIPASVFLGSTRVQRRLIKPTPITNNTPAKSNRPIEKESI